MDSFFEDTRNYLAAHYELVALFVAFFWVFWLYGVFNGHAWVYKNRLAVQSGINDLPVKAQKLIWLLFGLFWLAVSIFATVGLYLIKS